MKNKRHPCFVLRWLLLCAVAVSLVGTVPLFAQQTTSGTTGTTSGATTDSNATQTSLTEFEANRPGGGVFVNANGTMSRYTARDFDAAVSRLQQAAARASYRLPSDITARSPMRCVSLNRLEKNIANADGTITDEMLYLAGLQRITHVFYLSESKDIVIAGPAEGWFPGYEEMMIGVTTEQPVLELRHLITALRAYAPGGEGGNIVGCSIDPTPEGSIRLQQFQDRFNSTRGGSNQDFIRGVRESIGMQTIRVDGIPATTHAAQMMVAADYRMKRIALGADPAPIRQLKTFINNTVPNVSNAVFRWYFTPDYDSVILTEDRTGMQLVGNGVKLVGENELLFEGGERVVLPGGTLDRGSREFTQSFTQLYSQIARRALVFAQLRNWIDMLICAAHIQREDFYGKSGWSMEFFGNEEKYQLETSVAPREVEPVVGARIVNRRLVAPVGGGIVIDAELALSEEHAKVDTDNKIAGQQKQIALDIPEGVWWWDVR